MKRIKDGLLARWRMRGRLTPLRLLLAAAIFHVALTLTVFCLGQFEVLPGSFDENGTAISFASDAIKYRERASGLSEILGGSRVIDWAAAPQPFHLKLYSICFLLFGPLLGHNILSAEPLNLFFYSAILVLVFNLGRETCDRRVGLFAAATVALWPSFLLHTTQLLHDQIFIAGMLAFIFIILRWQTRTYSWRGALLWSAAGASAAVLIWLARPSMAGIMIVAGLLGTGLLAVKQVVERRVQTKNLIAMVLLLLLTIGVTQVIPRFVEREKRPPLAKESIKESMSGTLQGRIAARIAVARHRFTLYYSDAGSNIDGDVQFKSALDIIQYLPRAALIGFFAPFPEMWFTSGKVVGSPGRLLIGVETLLMYLVEALALFALWRRRRQFSVWLLFLVPVVGLCAAGLVVANVGALYRIRYLFLIMLIILAVEAATHLINRFSRKVPGTEELNAPPGSLSR